MCWKIYEWMVLLVKCRHRLRGSIDCWHWWDLHQSIFFPILVLDFGFSCKGSYFGRMQIENCSECNVLFAFKSSESWLLESYVASSGKEMELKIMWIQRDLIKKKLAINGLVIFNRFQIWLNKFRWMKRQIIVDAKFTTVIIKYNRMHRTRAALLYRATWIKVVCSRPLKPRYCESGA